MQRRTVVRTLYLFVLCLVLLSLAGQASKFLLGRPTVFGLVPLFYLDNENNLPVWYQSLALMLAALLLTGIWIAARRAKAPYARHWLGLALIFLYLSLDETGSVHERWIEPLQRLTGGMPPGMWQATWVLVGIPLVALVALAYMRFFLHLPWPERIRAALAACLFVGGAIMVEMVTSSLFITSDPIYRETGTYVLLVHAEETLEMLGVVVFIDLLLRRLARLPPFILSIAT